MGWPLFPISPGKYDFFRDAVFGRPNLDKSAAQKMPRIRKAHAHAAAKFDKFVVFTGFQQF